MIWTELIDHVAADTGLTKANVRQVLESLSRTVQERLLADDSVRIPGIGTLSAKWMRGRAVRDVQTRRKRRYDGRYVARFSVSASLKRALAQRTPQLLRDPQHQTALRTAEALISDIDLYHKTRVAGFIPVDAEGTAVDDACERLLGHVWTAARRTYMQRTPPEVRTHRDWLAVAAKRRWAGA